VSFGLGVPGGFLPLVALIVWSLILFLLFSLRQDALVTFVDLSDGVPVYEHICGYGGKYHCPCVGCASGHAEWSICVCQVYDEL
jgi:hypothetical protein